MRNGRPTTLANKKSTPRSGRRLAYFGEPSPPTSQRYHEIISKNLALIYEIAKSSRGFEKKPTSEKLNSSEPYQGDIHVVTSYHSGPRAPHAPAAIVDDPNANTLNSSVQQPNVTGTDVTKKVGREYYPDYLNLWLNTTTTPNSSSPEMQSETIKTALSSEYEDCDTDSDSEAFTENSDSSPEWDINGEITNKIRQEYIRRLLFSFDNIRADALPGGLSDKEVADSSDQSTTSGKRPATSSSSGPDDRTRPTKKAKIRSSRKGDDGDGEDDGNKRPPSSSIIKADSQAKRLFACPFVKRYPGRYEKFYSCTLRTVSRVKQHLQSHKIHQIPLYCARCSRTVDTEELRDEHVREETCPKNPKRSWEGITKAQKSKLSTRTQSNNESEKSWFEVWGILFPSVPPPSSPYVDMSLVKDLQIFREYLLSEGQVILDEILQTQLPDHLTEHLEELRSIHRTAYPKFVAELCTRWHSIHTLESSSAPRISLIRQIPQDFEPTSSPESGGSSSLADSVMGNSIFSGSQTDHESHLTAASLPVPLASSPLQIRTISEPSSITLSPQSSSIAISVPDPAHQEHNEDGKVSICQPNEFGWCTVHNQIFGVQLCGLISSDQGFDVDYSSMFSKSSSTFPMGSIGS